MCSDKYASICHEEIFFSNKVTNLHKIIHMLFLYFWRCSGDTPGAHILILSACIMSAFHFLYDGNIYVPILTVQVKAE